MAFAVLTEELSREGRATFEGLLTADDAPDSAPMPVESVTARNRDWVNELRAMGVPVPEVKH